MEYLRHATSNVPAMSLVMCYVMIPKLIQRAINFCLSRKSNV